MAKLAIVGTGFTGASLGLALRSSKLFDHIAGFDADRGRLRTARQAGAIDDESRSAAAAVQDAAVVVVTAPDLELVFTQIARTLTPGAVVSDTSLWRIAAERAASALPDGVHFVGGRPVLDDAGSGPEQATPEVFRGAVYCLTPGSSASEGAVDALSSIVAAIGAQPYFLEPAEHDGLTVASELLPATSLAALARTLTHDPTWPEAGKLAGDTLAQALAPIHNMPSSFWKAARANAPALGRWLEATAAALLDLRDRLDTAELVADWENTSQDLARWPTQKRQLHASTMPSKEELRPNLFGALGRRRR